MSNWISSKLRVAETFLQQIDQQAAESLNKNEKLQSDNELKLETPSSKIETTVPLKDQFKKRTTIPENNDFHKRDRISEVRTPGKLSLNSSTPPPPTTTTTTQTQTPSLAQPPPTTTTTTLTDSDWTELLSTPKQGTPSSANSNGISLMRSSRKDVKKLLEVKKKQSNNVNSFSKGTRRREIPLESSSNGGASSSKGSDGEESGSSDSVHRKSGVGSRSDESSVGEREKVGVLQSTDGSSILEKGSLLGTVDDGLAEIKTHVDDHSDGFRIDKSDAAAVRSSVPIDSRRDSSSPSDDRSGSETGSTSSSDSEDERNRRAERARRREKILAEKAAAKAVEAIKERENVVARLEGEKQSLEKILEERAKQQAQEASDMQMSMMETMEAVDVEKQKHNTTRMEALTRLTKLETQNTDLARSLATTQWNLGVEANRVTELRQQLELKEGVHGDLRRRISKIQQSGSSSNQLGAARGAEFEREMLEAEYSLTCDKIEKLNEKAKKLEENIKITRNEMENPTAVEVELKRRLSQLTDHLIQKQAQVESLSSEKATMLLRIETISRMLDDEKSNQQLSDMSGSSANDLEAGTWETSNSKLKPMFADRIRSGSQRFGSFILQLDALFSAGAAYLRRNPPAKLCALVYIVLLHFWVAYILMSNSQASETRSGAIVSLESINKTTGS